MTIYQLPSRDEEINLMNNEIVNLNILRDVCLPNLKILNILNNDINDYSVLRLIYFVAPNAVSSEMNRLIALITTIISASNLCSKIKN